MTTSQDNCPVGYGVCKECVYYKEDSCKYSELPDMCWNCGTPIKKGNGFCSKECEDNIREESRKEQEKKNSIKGSR